VRKRGHSFAALLDGMNRGRRDVRERWGVEMRWIADGVRDAESGPASVDTTLRWISGLDALDGVVALGLGGDEVGHPPAPFKASFSAARQAGSHVVAHAGETTGPETIWASIEELGAERIGHGVRAIEDERLVRYLADNRIPLELCPTSNVRTRVVESMGDHPFRRFDEAGIIVTVNSDDPALFGTSLTNEYGVIAETFGYGRDDLERLSLNALQASFLPVDDKEQMRREFLAAFEELRGHPVTGGVSGALPRRSSV